MLILNDSESTKAVSTAKLAGYSSRRLIMSTQSPYVKNAKSWCRGSGARSDVRYT
jgi:flagellar hook-associated protein FlgK